ncbi:MAG: hypothetical protein ACXW1N_08690 [Halobacteriota archaeon]
MSDSVADDTNLTNTASMSRLDVIGLVGDVLTELDLLRSKFDRGTGRRDELDDYRHQIDAVQRKLVRSVIAENTGAFRERTVSLKAVNDDLRQTITEVDKVVETLQTLVTFLEAAQKVADLAP